MHKLDELQITVLEDGSVRIETDKVSPANHAAAERAIASLSKLLGGQSETIRKREGQTHTHVHGHEEAGH